MGSVGESFAQVAAQAAAGAVVLTGNQRAARAVRRAADELLQARHPAWLTPRVLPFGAFLEELHEQVIVRGELTTLLLQPEQEAQLWRQVIERSAAGRVMLPESAAALASQSFRVAMDYGLPLESAQMGISGETRAFVGWALEFRRQLRSRGWSCASLLAEELTPLLPRLRLPAAVAAFLPEATPSQRAFLTALAEAGVQVTEHAANAPEPAAGTATRFEFAGGEDELRSAAEWARLHVEANPAVRVGLVFFDLGRRHAAIEAALRQALQPERLLGVASPAPFEIAAALPLSEYPLVRTALDLLAFIAAPLAFHDFELMLSSPYLALDAEQAAAFAAAHRQRARLQVSRAAAAGWAAEEKHGWPRLQWLLLRLPAMAELQSEHGAARWAQLAREKLADFGWPAGKLNSEEYQCSESWRELLARLAALDVLEWRGSFAQFVAVLGRASDERGFKPESLGAPVHVMDAHEADGSLWDALWIGSASDQLAFAPATAPALLPTAMLAEAGFPLPAGEESTQRAQRAAARLLGAAPEVVLSLALRGEDEGEQRWAPLFCGHAKTEPPVPRAGVLESFATAQLESLADGVAPALRPEEGVHGGTWIIADQSNCPFRAFAIRRLQAAAPRGPNEALTPMERGQLVELALQNFWEEAGESAALLRPGRDEAMARAADAALDAILPAGEDRWLQRFRRLERERLLVLLSEWLELESRRAPFRVLCHQEKIAFELAGLSLRGRMDRVDEVAGRRLVIDYKTGKVDLAGWKVPRPAAPQLPLYVLALEAQPPAVEGAAFAQVRRGDCCFRGYTTSADALPGGDGSRVFGAEFDEYAWLWRQELEKIATDFQRGEAGVDPRIAHGKSGSPCERCHLELLCRVADGDPDCAAEDAAEDAVEERDE